MPMELQVKLLRVLETGLFMRVGSTQAQETDVRVIAATNRSPEQALADLKLREDLLYRLNVCPIELPPLRERTEDVPLLAKHFLAEVCDREGEVKSFSPAALARLSAYRWPGNVRELRNVVQRSFVMSTGPVITDEWLPSSVGNGADPAAPGAVGDGAASVVLPIGISLAQAERQLILTTLAHYNHQRERTAAVLGVSLKTLYNRLKEYSSDKAGEPPTTPPP